MTSFRPPTPVSLLDITSIRQPCRSAYLLYMRNSSRGKQRRLVAAGAGADFEDDVLLVVRILGDEQDLQLGEQRVAPRDQRLQLLLRELAHVGVAGRGELLGLRDVVHDRLVLAEPLDERLDLGQRLGVLPVFGRIALHLGGAEQRASALRSAVLRRQLVEHSYVEREFAVAESICELGLCVHSSSPRHRRQKRDFVAVARAPGPSARSRR